MSGWRPSIPPRASRRPSLPRLLPHSLSNDEVERLLAAPGLRIPEAAHAIRDAAILELFYSCGLRISELANLPVNHADLAESMVRVRGKGSKVRIVPWGARAREAIRPGSGCGRPASVGRHAVP
jgi:site-specific recombinase XerD